MALLLYCLFNFLCLWLLLKNFNFFRLYSLFIASFYLYYFFSFLNYFAGNNILGYHGHEVLVEMAFANTFVLGYMLAGRLYRKKTGQPEPLLPSFRGMMVTAYLLMATGIIMYAAFIWFAYGGIRGLSSDRYEVFLKKQGWGSLLIGLNICFAGILLRAGYFMLYRRQVKQPLPVLPLLLAVALLAFQYRNSDRTNMLFFLIPVTLLLLYVKPKANYYLLAIAPMALILMQVMAFQRSLKNTDQNHKFDKFYHNQRLVVLAGLFAPKGPKEHHLTAHDIQHARAGIEQVNKTLDAVALAKVWMDLSKHGELLTPGKVDTKIIENIDAVPVRYGGTIADALMNLPPLWLVKHRKPLPAQWFVATFYPQEYKKGGGMGFSIIAESVIDLRYPGPFIFGLLAGLLLLGLEARIGTSSFYYFIVYCIAAFYVFNIPRSGITGVIKPMLVAVVIPMVLARYAARHFEKRGNTTMRQ